MSLNIALHGVEAVTEVTKPRDNIAMGELAPGLILQRARLTSSHSVPDPRMR